jgi:hypothetical protein
MRKKTKANRILVGKKEGKRPLERPKFTWMDIKLDLRAIAWGGTDWTDLAQDIVKTVGHFRIS